MYTDLLFLSLRTQQQQQAMKSSPLRQMITAVNMITVLPGTAQKRHGKANLLKKRNGERERERERERESSSLSNNNPNFIFIFITPYTVESGKNVTLNNFSASTNWCW